MCCVLKRKWANFFLTKFVTKSKLVSPLLEVRWQVIFVGEGWQEAAKIFIAKMTMLSHQCRIVCNEHLTVICLHSTPTHWHTDDLRIFFLLSECQVLLFFLKTLLCISIEISWKLFFCYYWHMCGCANNPPSVLMLATEYWRQSEHASMRGIGIPSNVTQKGCNASAHWHSLVFSVDIFFLPFL